jgi:hypothetical protein
MSVFSPSARMIPYANKAAYAHDRRTFTITALEYQPQAGYNGVDRWAVTVILADKRTVEIITLPANDKRNSQLRTAQAQIERYGRFANLRLVRAGSAYYFRPAEARTT